MKIVETPFGSEVLVVTTMASAPPADWFSPEEQAEAGAFRLSKRREEWLASRGAAKQLASALGLCREPRDCRVASRQLLVGGSPAGVHLSLSHSAPYAGAAISPRPVGIDVQVIRPFDDAAAHLFLSEEEIAAMRECSLPDALLHWWCAKEAAWKRFSPRYATMRQLPLQLLREESSGLHFDLAESVALGELIVAISH
jgi:4'-phosphopantetheinyl transferase EntD